MDTNTEETDWDSLSPEEKKRALFCKQKDMLTLMLKTGAINEAQYRKSLTGLTEKMGYEKTEEKP